MNRRCPKPKTQADRAIASAVRVAVEQLEKRVLLAALEPTQFSAIKAGLNDMVAWGQTVETYSLLAQELPIVGQSIGQVTNVSQLFFDSLVHPLNSLVAPSGEEIRDAILGALPGGSTVQFIQSAGELKFDVKATLSSAAAMISLNFGENSHGVGIHKDSKVPIVGVVDLNFSFGLNLSAGLAASEAFFINIKTDEPSNPTGLSVKASIDHSSFELSGNVGMLGIRIGDGTPGSSIALNAAVQLGLVDPDPTDGHITLAELMGNSLSSLVPLTGASASGTLNASVPVSATVGSFSPTGMTLAISDANLFASPLPSVSLSGPDLQHLLNFNNLTPATLIGTIDQLAASLQTIAGGLNPTEGIPFVDTALSNIIDFGEAVTNFTSKLYDTLLTGSSSYSASSQAPSNGRLTETLVFFVAVNDGNLTRIELPHGDTAGNGNLAQLVGQINGKLSGTGVTASAADGTITFSAAGGDNVVLRFQANQAGMKQLGFASTISTAHFRFSSIQELAVELADLIPTLNLAGVDLQYDPAKTSVAFNLELSHAFEKDLHLHFLEDVSIPVLGTLSLAGGAHAHVNASVGLDLRVGFDLTSVGASFTLEPSTPLASLNGGKGVPVAGAGKDDFRVTTANGTVVNVSLATATTVQDVMNLVNAGGFVTLSINPNDPHSLLLVDNTSPVGTTVFRVERLNNSVAAQALGINSSDIDGDGVIAGSPLHGDSLLKRAFFEEGGSVSAEASFHATDLSLRAALGLLELGVAGEADFTVSASATLEDPETVAADGRITPGEFLSAATSALTGVTFDALGHIKGSISVDGLDDFGLVVGGDPELMVEFTAGTSGFDIDASLTGLDDLLSFSNFSTENLLAIVTQALDFVRSSDLKLFNDKLPLINKSINDLLNFTQPLLNAFNGVSGDLGQVKQKLLEKLTPIKQAIQSDDLLDHISESQLSKLLDGLDFFERAVMSLQDTLEPGEVFRAPGRLMAAMSSLRVAIVDIAFENKPSLPAGPVQDNFNAKLNQLYNSFTDASSLLPAVQKLADFFFKALGLTLPDLSPTGAIATVRASLEASIISLQEDFTDTELVNLIAARDKIDDALKYRDVLKLATAFSKLRQGVSDVQALIGPGDPDNPKLQALRGVFNSFLDKFRHRVDLGFLDDKLEVMLAFDIAELSLSGANAVPLDFTFDGGAIPVKLQTGGTLDVMVGAGLNLHFGMDLGGASLLPYLLPSTNLIGRAQISSTDLTGELSIGGISAIKVGTAAGPGTSIMLGDGTGPAQLIVGFSGTSPIQLSEIPGRIQVGSDGGFEMTLPVKAPLLDAFNITASLDPLTDLSSFTIAVPPDLLSSLQGSTLSLLEFFRNLPEFIDLLSQAMQSDILGKLPLVGSEFTDAGETLAQFNVGYIKPVVDKVNEWLPPDEEDHQIVKALLQRILFETLGPGLPETDPLHTLVPGAGLNILAKADGTPVTAHTDIDVQVIVDDNGTPEDPSDDKNLLNDPNAEVLVNLRLKGDDTLKAHFDLGLSALEIIGIGADGAIEVGVGFDINMGFGISKTEGFFLNLPDPGTPEVKFDLNVGFETGSEVTAKLFFLDLKATDNGGTGFTGAFEMDFDGSKVPLSGIGSMISSVDVDLEVSAALDIHLEATINGDDNFPSIEADLGMLWSFSLLDPNGGSAPTIALNDITLDLGKFLSGPLVEVLNGLNDFLTPIRPLIQVLDTEVPIISQLYQLVGQGPFTFIDGISLFGEGGTQLAEFLRIVVAADRFIDDITSISTDSIRINLGNFDFAGQDLRTGSRPTVPNNLPTLDLNASLDNVTGDPTAVQQTKNLMMGSQDPDSGLGDISFPIIQNPASILNLLFGQDVDLVTWDIPRFDVKFEFSQAFGPIVPPYPIFAKVGGGFEMFADFSIGLDTRGIRTENFINGFYFGDRENVSTGADVPELGLNMYLTAGAELNIGGIVVAGVEGGIKASITANWNDTDGNGKVHLDELLVNMQRGVECIFDLAGELTAFLRAYLQVEIDLGLFNITLIDTSFTLIEVTLFSFTVTCPPLPPPEPARMDGGILKLNIGEDASKRRKGDTDGDEVIRVVGERDIRDESGNLTQTQDLNGDGIITEEELGGDLDGDGLLNDGVYAVIGFGQTRLFGRASGATLAPSFFKSTTLVTKIEGHGGQGDDEIALESVNVPAWLTGGPGNDKVIGGNRNDTIDGGDGDDTIHGGAGNDSITGGAGNDELFGGDGADTIHGGAGDDTIYGGNNDGQEENDQGDSLLGGAGNDHISGHAGNDFMDGGAGADFLSGGPGNDTMLGGADDDTLLGEDGNDSMDGGAGSDQMKGGAGNDTMRGDIGDDWMEGGEGNDSMFGGEGHDTMVGGGSNSGAGSDGNDVIYGEAGNDKIAGGNAAFGSVTLWGGTGNDTIIGGAGSDLIYGQGGTDIIYGDGATFAGAFATSFQSDDAILGGNDTIYGNDGADIIVAGGGNDLVFGGDDNAVDVILGDNGTISITGSVVTNVQSTHFATGGNDTLRGGAGDDIVIGGRGNDSILGNEGHDIVIGDHGRVQRNTSGSLLKIFTIGPDHGGDDTILGYDGDDTILGGTGDDSITGNAGHDILMGDNGELNYLDGELLTVLSTDPTHAGADLITGAAGHDTIIGGGDQDTLAGGGQGDIILGDNGKVTRAGGFVTRIETTFPGQGDDDSILGGTSADTVFGGDGDDRIEGGDDVADDVLGGDNGLIELTGGIVTLIRSTDPTHGGADSIWGGPGDDIIVGGSGGSDLTTAATPGGDSLFGEDGNDIIVGDNAEITRTTAGRVLEIKTILPTHGGHDTLVGANGADTLLGGFGDDRMLGDNGPDVAASAPGPDIMLGDNGRLAYDIVGAAATLRLVETTDPALGGNDVMFGDAGDDTMLGGAGGDSMRGGIGHDVMLGDNGFLDYETATGQPVPVLISTRNPNDGASDTMFGEDGNDTMMGGTDDEDMSGGNGLDLMFGDHGKVYPQQPWNDNFFSIDTGEFDGGGSDTIRGDADDDTILGGQKGDLIFGGSGHDDIIGGHNNPDDVYGGRFDGGDTMDGGTGNDLLAGDNARVIRQMGPTYTSPLVRSLTGSAIYDLHGEAQIDGTHRTNPTGAVGRDVTLMDHADNTPAGRFGNDLMAGGANDDTMFGQLGNDVMRGDGFIDISDWPLAEAKKSVSNATDGDDYMEGNGGDDTMFGDLGQDDMIGGNSDLFGLTDRSMRPDGSDLMYGGDGTAIGRNHLGAAQMVNDAIVTEATGHARDADVMMGDNANVFRLVNASGAGSFRTFNYDNYSPALKIIPRATVPLDYNPIDPNDNPIGGGDRMHGEAGDDSMHGMTGHDIMFGEGQDDDIIGGVGNDWISGGTGDDGVLGDDGRILTSRNGTAEPLSGVNVATSQTLISTPGKIQQATINVTGQLKKAVNMSPFSADPSWSGMADEQLDGPPNFDDVIYGGWGNDSLHGGSGDDAISGAEALPVVAVRHPDAGVIVSGYDHPFNPGNMLAFNPDDPDGWHYDPTRRAGEFFHYDEYNPLKRITIAEGATIYPFLLNFDANEGPVDPASTSNPKKKTDGEDRIFGDLGNDWLVGGTGRDNLYGGFGNDLLNVDDDHGTNNGLNNQPDTDASYEDRAYGGAGRDVLIANTGGDRLIDWVGEFNSYLVPFAPFGMATVSRTLQPQLATFLYALSASDGADQTRAAKTGADPARNGEPEGELGLVLQKDAAWRQQTGAPADPQAGNIPGGKRDVLRSANFNDNTTQGFVGETGVWNVSGGRYHVEPEQLGADAVSLFYVDTYVPFYFELLATINAVKPIAGFKANAYLVFDYQSPTDFKYAGLNVSTNKLEIGRRTARGWIVENQMNMLLRDGRDYNLFLAVNGNAVTLVVDNRTTLSHTFEPRLDPDGFPHTISEGMVGLGASGARAQIDNVVVQQVQVTTQKTANFNDGVAGPLFGAPTSGSWAATGGRYAGTAAGSDPALSLLNQRVAANALLELVTTLRLTSATAQGGFVFDYYSPTDFKFVMVSAATKQITLGHYTTGGGWVTVASFGFGNFKVGTDFTLGVTLRGSTVNVVLNGKAVISHAYNALLTDGEFGLFSRSGTASFDDLIIRSDDQAFGGE